MMDLNFIVILWSSKKRVNFLRVQNPLGKLLAQQELFSLVKLVHVWFFKFDILISGRIKKMEDQIYEISQKYENDLRILIENDRQRDTRFRAAIVALLWSPEIEWLEKPRDGLKVSDEDWLALANNFLQSRLNSALRNYCDFYNGLYQ
ncbi:hypothetical protein MIR68_005149 [Amoeboaphelidium protococcarum]|nr:hypothetical protein MIR68_005149 [Amoeboaphelidium protococcarum]